MTLRFPDHPDVVFEDAPLIVVLCQVKFPPILALLTAAGIAGFQEALRDEYPALSPEGGAEIELGVGGLNVSEKAPVWRMTTDDQQWRVSVAVDMVSLETYRYTSADDFLSRFNTVLDGLARTVHPESSTRVGLRKINDLSHPDVHDPRGWRDWLRPELLGLTAAADLPGQISLSFSELRLEDEHETIAVRHGSLPDDVSKYRLDLDYFTPRPLSIEPEGELTETVRGFAAGTTALFHWCLTERLYTWLRPHPRRARDGGSGS